MATILRGWLEAPSRLAAVQDELVALCDSLRVAGNNSASAQAAEEVVEFVAGRKAKLAPTASNDDPASQRAA
jgi:hypothetical protein